MTTRTLTTVLESAVEFFAEFACIQKTELVSVIVDSICFWLLRKFGIIKTDSLPKASFHTALSAQSSVGF